MVELINILISDWLIQELWGLFLKEKQQQSVTPAEPEYECPPLEDVSYYIPDEEQCDKYEILTCQYARCAPLNLIRIMFQLHL